MVPWQRAATVGGVMAAVLALLSLMGADLYLRFPTVMTTGDAHLQRWIGSEPARLAFMVLALVVGSGYILVAFLGTRDPVAARCWQLGAAVGAGAGMLSAALYLLGAGLGTTGQALRIAPMALSGALLLGPLILGAAAIGRAGAGAVAGFWFALALVLLGSLGMLAADTFFSERLLHGAWVHYHSRDPLCRGVRGATLLGCAVGDDMGFVGTLYVAGPLLGLGLGALGGLAGRARGNWGPRATLHSSAALRPPILFSALLAVVMMAELAGNLW